MQVFAIPQPDIVAGYNRGDLDGGFVWDPALTELKKNGKVLVTSQGRRRQGRADVLGLGGDRRLRQGPSRIPEGLRRRDRQIADLVRPTTRQPGVPDSENAKLLAGLLGGTPADQANGLKNLNLLPLKTQASEAWLGGGEKSGLAKILKDTAVFLKEQKKISDVLPSYAAFVTPDVVIAVEKGAGS